jgi:hypothetical protein
MDPKELLGRAAARVGTSAFALVLVVAGCGSSGAAPAGKAPGVDGSTGQAEGGVSPTRSEAGSAADGGAVTGTMGGPCNPDGTCGPGLACVGDLLVQNPERYCAPSCVTEADCQAFAQTSYAIGVPDTYTPIFGSTSSTDWKATKLVRGVGCASTAGTATGPKHCVFGCANFEAVAPDASGKLTLCYCLPGYRLKPGGGCEFGSSHQCSIFSYGTDAMRKELLDRFGIQTQSPKCDACNSDFSSTNTIGCHSNEFFCDIRTAGLNGDCAELLTTQQFNQCVTQKTNFSCTCASSCADSADPSAWLACYGATCPCSATTAPLPAPSCAGDAGAAIDGAATDASAADGAPDTGSPFVGVTPACNACASANCMAQATTVAGDSKALALFNCATSNHCSGDCCFCTGTTGGRCSTTSCTGYAAGPCATEINLAAVGTPTSDCATQGSAVGSACQSASTSCGKGYLLAQCVATHCSTECGTPVCM